MTTGLQMRATSTGEIPQASARRVAFRMSVNALEQQRGFTPERMLTEHIAHIINGFVPATRFLQAGERARRAGASESQVERWAREWLACGVNPYSQVCRNLRRASALALAAQLFSDHAPMTVRTYLVIPADACAATSWRATRVLAPGYQDDPAPCAATTLVAYAGLLSRIDHNAKARPARRIVGLAELAAMTGARGCTAEAAAMIDASPDKDASRVARALGCSLRTLQRRLAQDGTTWEQIRMASRLLRATGMLWSTKSLGSIATECGFASLSHMDNAFRVSTSLSPGLLRSIANAGESSER